MFIRTSRLFLRPAWREDSASLSRLLADDGFQRDLTGSPWLEALGDFDQLLAPANDPRDVRLLIFRRTDQTPTLIGAAGVGRSVGRPEFGLWLAQGERRRGFALEAGKALLSLAFDGLRIRQIWTPALRSGGGGRLIARLGFKVPQAEATTAVLDQSDWHSGDEPLAA